MGREVAAFASLCIAVAAVLATAGTADAQGPVLYSPPLDGSPRITAWLDHQCARYSGCENGYMTPFTGDSYANCGDSDGDWRGPYCYDGHPGIDYSASVGSAVRAAASGTVSREGWAEGADLGLGRVVVIAHDDGLETSYCHLSSENVSVGQQVSGGVQIGATGRSGYREETYWPAHLHFEVRKTSTNKPTDPFGWRGNGADPLAAAGAGGEASVCRQTVAGETRRNHAHC